MYLINRWLNVLLFRYLPAAGVLSLLLACSSGDPRPLYESLIVEFNDVQSISISALNTVITTGENQQITVTGTTSQNTTIDLSEMVSWSVDDASLAFISATGLLQSISQDGMVTVTATLSGFSASMDVTFSSAALVSIEVKADTLTEDLTTSVCRPLPLKAMATYDDASLRNITPAVSWSTTTAGATLVSDSTPPSITHYDVVATNVTATLGISSPAAAVTLVDDITSMALSPAAVTLTVGSEQSFVLSADYGSETEPDITAAANWQSSIPSVADFANNDGIVTALAVGTTTITAACGSTILPVSSTVTVDVNNISAFEIGPEPLGFELTLGSTQQMTATAYYVSDPQTPVDVTDQVSWSVDSGSVAISVDSFGLVTADALGFGKVVASFSGETADITVYVVP
ncbi:MAG: Ig-like domain-containing protein [Gammaproteobacteria bacterium]|nr:Ig-like domain-containing protein [Gammaproteobacteria bacterium]